MNLTSPAALQGISRFFLLRHAYLNSTGPLKGLGHEIKVVWFDRPWLGESLADIHNF
jgi:hypothetical protein